MRRLVIGITAPITAEQAAEIRTVLAERLEWAPEAVVVISGCSALVVLDDDEIERGAT